jgi:hypothetical protein
MNQKPGCFGSSFILHPSSFILSRLEHPPMNPPRRSRTWIWYFVILAILAVLAVTIMIRYNQGQQLTREQVDQARALWQHKGPKDYDLDYTEAGTVTDRYRVQVRDGKVVSALRDGKPLEERLYIFHDMPALFDALDGFLQEDARPGSPRVYMVATFDSTDGHLLKLVRRVMGTDQRLEINVTLTPVAAS